MQHPLAAIFAPQIVALAADYSHVFGPSTSFGKDLMPRVAALLGVPQVSDLMAVEGAYRFRRPIYAGNAIVTVEADPARKLVATVRVASFEAAGTGGSAAIDSKTLERRPALAYPLRRRQSGSTDRPDLQTATQSCPAAAPSAARRTSSCCSASPTRSARPSAPRAPPSMPAMRPTKCRSARPARSSPPRCTSPSASPAPFSI